MRTDTETMTRGGHDPLAWLAANIELNESNAAEFWYEHMDSQSDEALALVYVPFDAARRGHFVDRGQILDFVAATGGGRVLDFGPGDGWPSLLMAPMVDEVVGVDGSRHRVAICKANARRLGIQNVRFVRAAPQGPLPLEDESFDAVTAASSVEQTPDVRATLAELRRVLRPGGRLRMSYESLGVYRGGREREVSIIGDRLYSRLLILDRDADAETVRHMALAFDMPKAHLVGLFALEGSRPAFAGLTPQVLGRLREHLVEAAGWTTRHPSCRTWLALLEEAGFSSARATWDGGRLAGELFDRLPQAERPADMAAVDELLRPMIEPVVAMEAPPEAASGQPEPLITAVK